MKTIAYVINDFPILSETFIGNEIRAMEKRGHHIVPFVFRTHKGMAQPEDIELAKKFLCVGDIPARRINKIGLLRCCGCHRALSFVHSQRLLGRASLLWNAAKLAGELIVHNCGHVHAHFAGGGAAHAIVAARLAGIPMSFTCHGHDVYAEPEDLPAKLAAADKVIAVCCDLAGDLKRIQPNAEVVSIACGTNPARFTPRPAGQSSNGRLLFVGRLVPQKGVEDIIQALENVPQREIINVDIIGDGPLRNDLEKRAVLLIRQRGHKVRFLGSQDGAWISSNGPSYAAVILPFKTAPDGSRDTGPLVVKEAMAMGLPVISTTYMGVKEMVTQETGILVEPGDHLALGAAIRTITTKSEPALRAMGLAGRKRVEALFTLEAQAAKLSEMIEAV